MKISRIPDLTAAPVFTRLAFTLIELLVVISIIAVLASLSLGAANGVQLAAKKASAKNDLAQLVSAVKQYYVDYGQYPSPNSTTAPTNDYAYGPSTLVGNDNSLLLDVLRCPPSAANPANVTALNPRQIKYLEVADVKNSTNPASGIVESKSGAAQKGDWVDPWGMPYVVFVDGDYDGCITVKSVYNGTNLGTSGTVAISGGAASVGLYFNKKGLTTPSAHSFDKTTDLLSWQ